MHMFTLSLLYPVFLTIEKCEVTTLTVTLAGWLTEWVVLPPIRCAAIMQFKSANCCATMERLPLA